ncbi:hypothetical protein RJ640_003754 [Escallonia rubra]|uniref:Metallothionein-like protein n=1 Tax=Escallonia rubra TaxID=112253 RepID=A0AA88UIB7_9ASTE|nr:hypothetical protein RJ640_003754 [Escallonia rubra]
MSCCGGNCGCGSGCKCGSGCGGCGMYPDIEKTTTATIIGGVAPVKTYYEGTEKSFGAEGGHACKCLTVEEAATVALTASVAAAAGTLRDQRRALEQKEAIPANVDQTVPVIHAPVRRPKPQTKQLQLVSPVSESVRLWYLANSSVFMQQNSNRFRYQTGVMGIADKSVGLGNLLISSGSRIKNLNQSSSTVLSDALAESRLLQYDQKPKK